MKILTSVIAASLVFSGAAHAQSARSRHITALVLMARSCADDVLPVFLSGHGQPLSTVKAAVRWTCSKTISRDGTLTPAQADGIMDIIVDNDLQMLTR